MSFMTIIMETAHLMCQTSEKRKQINKNRDSDKKKFKIQAKQKLFLVTSTAKNRLRPLESVQNLRYIHTKDVPLDHLVNHYIILFFFASML